MTIYANDPSNGQAAGCGELRFSLEFDPWKRLVLTDANGATFVDVDPVRAFPLSDPGHWISLRDGQTGREILMVPDPAALPEPVQRTLLHALTEREFMPAITHVHRIVSHVDGAEWEVNTDRGRRRIHLGTEHYLRRLANDRFLITDRQGIRYVIPSVAKLDSGSRRLLEHYLY